MKNYLLSILICALPLPAQAKFFTLNSDTAAFEGDRVIFSGEVQATGEIGSISAKEATIESGKNRFNFKTAILRGDVIIETGEGTIIRCEEALLDNKTRKALLTGTAKSRVSGKDSANGIEFAADRITAQKLKEGEIYLLAGNVEVNSQNVGNIFCRDILYIKKNRGLENIDCFGKATVTLKKNACSCKIISRGEIHIDHKAGKIKATSPLNKEGLTEVNQQLSVQDYDGKIHSDVCFITYSINDKNPSLEDAVFEGNVRLENKAGPLLQYVLAERAEYNHKSRRIHLFSTPPNRVLCYDRPNDLEISAPELIIYRGTKPGSDNIKGIGDVRFSLKKDEIERLKQHIKL